MRTKNFNLVVLHHEEVFDTREQALNYLSGYYKPYSIDGEPLIVKYGETTNPNLILAFGTSNNAPGSFYAIDMAKATEELDELMEVVGSDKEELEYISEILDGVVKSTGLTLDPNKITDKISYDVDPRDEVIGDAVNIAEAIDLLSKYCQQNFNEGELSVEDTNSVRLIYEVNPNGGKILKAEIIVSETSDTIDNVNFNNNIIGIKNDGIYAASHLAYDEAKHELIFTTSGIKNGRFQDDAIVQKVNLGKHTKLIADNEGNSVSLVVTEDAENYTSTISANLEIANRENNILEVVDGKTFVDGTARNIKYNAETVDSALTQLFNTTNDLDTRVDNAAKTAHIEGGQTDTMETLTSALADGGTKITGNVRLGSDNSIVVRDGGLEANIVIDVDVATNKLIVKIGNQTITKQLPGVELFESAEYNDANEELIITFRTGNTLVIPIHGIIHTWDTLNNQNSPIVLTKDVVTGGVDTLSGDIKLRSTDNLIAKENGNLYVSELNIDNKVNTEANRATQAESALQTAITNLSNTTSSQFANVADTISDIRDSISQETTNRIQKDTELDGKITTLTQSIATEKERAETAESALDTKIDTLETNLISRINHDIEDVQHLISDETERATTAEEANAARIEEVAETIADSSSQAVDEAKLYTDTKILAEKTAREAKDTEIENNIITAVRDASDDATTKANAAEANANAYTDTKVAAEKTRAEAAEQANATAISDLTTEVDKKIEQVTIEPNGNLQYFLKVDGVTKGEINIPKDQFLSSVSYNPSTKEITFVFETTSGTSTTVVRVDDLVDTYLAGNGLKLEENVFSVKINEEDGEPYLTVTENGLKLSGINSALALKANVSDVNLISDKVDVLNGNEATEGSIKNAIKIAKDYADSKDTLLQQQITDNETTRQNADANLQAAIANETLERQNADNLKLDKSTFNEYISQSGSSISEITEELEDLQELVDTKANANDVYTKQESDAKYLTQHQDISNLATKAEVSEVASDLADLTSTVDDMKFVTEESNTVRMTMDKQTGAAQRTLTADVKLKTIPGVENANIIKSDANGIYATVSFSYNKASNTITFNDGNGDKQFELNNFGILQDAIYDSVNKSIVLIVKKDDETTDRITIPVDDLVNTWDVANSVSSPVVLEKTTTQEGEDLLSADISILNNDHNLLKNRNGSLFVNDDSNEHFALWGDEESTVQGVINILKERTDELTQIKQNIATLQQESRELQSSVLVLQTDLSNQKERLTSAETNITNLQARQNTLEVGFADLSARVTATERIVNNLKEKLGNIEANEKTVAERLNDIEDAIARLIDFGEYPLGN